MNLKKDNELNQTKQNIDEDKVLQNSEENFEFDKNEVITIFEFDKKNNVFLTKEKALKNTKQNPENEKNLESEDSKVKFFGDWHLNFKRFFETNTNEEKPIDETELLNIDTSIEKSAIKFIKKLRISRIKNETAEHKNKIKSASSKEEKNLIKEEFKNKVKEGKEKNSDNNIIELFNVNKYYITSGRYERILKNINLKLEKGKFILILGPSGTGKTTLLNVISGLDYINSGNLIVSDNNLFYLNENQRIKFRADNLSFVFQSYNLIATLTVEENIKIGANLRSKDAEEIPISEILENLGLKDQAKKYPYQLSGGQQQRVSIARALAKNPKILFADEPTGALDEERGKETIKLLMDINKKYGTTLIIVTHNPNLQEVADIIIKIKDGKIDQYIENENSKNVDVNNVKWG